MRVKIYSLLAILLFIITGCEEKHLITDVSYRVTVDSAFHSVLSLASNRNNDLFSVFDHDLPLEQQEALKFLYAFMPLNDLADYDGEFFLANVGRTLSTRQLMPWGTEIPEELFLHYVLPVRVNNENLDSFRIIFHDEIAGRIKGKSMLEAALEINHWCHEKVTYQPSDSRTSSPVFTILSARGRCGEESTFTVAALRTAGIPARQVYTPRWAHSDDNHAWVEFWAGGRWYYMGACEPEPVPDRGWFTEPARRAMMVHTKSFGAFSGDENILKRSEKYTEINNLSKYAITKKIFVRTLSADHKTLKDAMVEYQLYNYAEFYPIAAVPSGENGLSTLETGLGDLLIWGYKDDCFGFRKISVAETDTIDLILENRQPGNISLDLDLDVPVKRSPLPDITGEIISSNNARLDDENRIREAYINTWITRKEAVALAVRLKTDTGAIADLLSRSMGNYNQIVELLGNVPDTMIDETISMLQVVSEKDLRDTRASVFLDHLKNTSYVELKDTDRKLFVNYILNPRISSEILSPWRSWFLEKLTADFRKDAFNDPEIIAGLLDSLLVLADKENYSRTPLTPTGTWSLKVTDSRSRAICYVAICRSLGIASRLDPGRNIPQFLKDGVWHDVYFKDQKAPSPEKGFVRFSSSDKNPVPQYYIHFTLARFENGRYNTLEYNENTGVNDFSEELQLPPGYYMLVTGNRLDDSRILASLTFFNLNEGEHRNIEIRLRQNMSPPVSYGHAELSDLAPVISSDNEMQRSLSEAGAVLLWTEPDREPTKHVLNDLRSLSEELNRWPGCFIFLNVSGSNTNDLRDPASFAGLPERTVFTNDLNLSLLKKMVRDSSVSDISFPVVIMVKSNGNIILHSSGYRIGIGEQILRLTSNTQ